MRFQRLARPAPVEWTARKAAAAAARPARQAAKDARAYPLLADQLAPPPPVDLAVERAHRDASAVALMRELRASAARVWREARRDYFAATPAQRAAIAEAWRAWRGPAAALYFRYVVDLHTGVQSAREERRRFENEQRRRATRQRLEAQGRLELPDA